MYLILLILFYSIPFKIVHKQLIWFHDPLIGHHPPSRRRQWHPTPVLLPGKSHGRRNLVGCSPWGCEESDTTERLPFHFSLSCIGEGNGNPLQCSCLENPRDGGTGGLPSMGLQSGTRLKWLSSIVTVALIVFQEHGAGLTQIKPVKTMDWVTVQ